MCVVCVCVCGVCVHVHARMHGLVFSRALLGSHCVLGTIPGAVTVTEMSMLCVGERLLPRVK